MFDPYLRTIKLVLLAALAACVLFGGFKLYRMGYRSAETEWSTKYERLVTDTELASNRETIRQSAANERARLQAEDLLSQLEAERQARAADRKELEDEARADRDAGRVCLGADSVRRITKATAPTPQ